MTKEYERKLAKEYEEKRNQIEKFTDVFAEQMKARMVEKMDEKGHWIDDCDSFDLWLHLLRKIASLNADFLDVRAGEKGNESRGLLRKHCVDVGNLAQMLFSLLKDEDLELDCVTTHVFHVPGEGSLEHPEDDMEDEESPEVEEVSVITDIDSRVSIHLDEVPLHLAMRIERLEESGLLRVFAFQAMARAGDKDADEVYSKNPVFSEILHEFPDIRKPKKENLLALRELLEAKSSFSYFGGASELWECLSVELLRQEKKRPILLIHFPAWYADNTMEETEYKHFQKLFLRSLSEMGIAEAYAKQYGFCEKLFEEMMREEE